MKIAKRPSGVATPRLRNPGLPQQTAIVLEFEGCTVKEGQVNCDVTMVVANGLNT